MIALPHTLTTLQMKKNDYCDYHNFWECKEKNQMVALPTNSCNAEDLVKVSVFPLGCCQQCPALGYGSPFHPPFYPFHPLTATPSHHHVATHFVYIMCLCDMQCTGRWGWAMGRGLADCVTLLCMFELNCFYMIMTFGWSHAVSELTLINSSVRCLIDPQLTGLPDRQFLNPKVCSQ